MNYRDYIIGILILIIIGMGVLLFRIYDRDRSPSAPPSANSGIELVPQDYSIIKNYDSATEYGTFNVENFLIALSTLPRTYEAYSELWKTIDFRSGFAILMKLRNDQKISQEKFDSISEKYLEWEYRVQEKDNAPFLAAAKITSLSEWKRTFSLEIMPMEFSKYADFKAFLTANPSNDLAFVISPYSTQEITQTFGQMDRKAIIQNYEFTDDSSLDYMITLHELFLSKNASECAHINKGFVRMLCDGYYSYAPKK